MTQHRRLINLNLEEGEKIWKALIKIKVKVKDKIGKTSEINNERLFQED